MKKRVGLVVFIVTAGLTAVLIGAHTIFASPMGITGYSGNPATGGLDCNICHTGGEVPEVNFAGQGVVAPGELVTYTLKIAGGQETGGGFNVSTTDGVLSIITDTTDVQLLSGELTHTEPKMADANGEVDFSFQWTAPITPGIATFYGVGNSVNLAEQTAGDAASRVVLEVVVGNFDEKVYLPAIVREE